MIVLTVFRSRAQALDFLSACKSVGIPASAVNTPKEAGVGCGLSVKFEDKFLPRARAALQKKRYSAFNGFMGRRGERYIYL